MTEEKEPSHRMNVRIPMAQYELMMKFGSVLGLTTDAACVKHFLTLGLQSSAGSLTSVLSSANSDKILDIFQKMTEGDNQHVEQLDLVEAVK